MTSQSLTINQVSRMARQAVHTTSTSTRADGHEPTSKFAKAVETNAFRPEYRRRSLVAAIHQERFPFLAMFEAQIDFGLMTPAQIAAVYIAARTQRDTWHTSFARVACEPSAELVECVNGYFDAAAAPQHEELHEMRAYVDEFLPKNSALASQLFWAATAELDTSSLEREPSHSGAGDINAPAAGTDLAAYIFESFSQPPLK